MFEDALAGVEAGRAGDFGIVIGVDRVGQADALREHGADVVVAGPRRAARRPVSERAAFDIEPWSLFEPELDLDGLAHTESVFALSNGHIGLRGNLDEGEPFFLPGTYLNGFYETRPLPYAEAAYGNPEAGQTVVNVTNGKIIRLLVDDEPFDIRYGELLRHERRLDLRDGMLQREVEWRSPTGGAVRLRTSGWCPSRSARSPPCGSRSSRWRGRCGWSCRASWWPTSRCPRQTKDPRAAAALAAPLVGRGALHPRAARGARPHHAPQPPADGGRDGPRRRGTGRDGDRGGEPRRPRPRHDHRRHRAGQPAAGRQDPRLRLVERPLAAVPPRPGRRRARRRPQVRLGRPRAASSATTSTTSGTARTSSWKATSSSSRRCASRSSTRSRRAPAPSSGRSRRRA